MAIKPIIAYASVFVLTLLIMLVVNTPAHWVYDTLVKQRLENLPISIAKPKGVILRGQTQLASIPERLPVALYVQNIEWFWQPQELLRGQFSLQIDASEVELANKALGDYSIWLSWGINGYAIGLRDQNALLKLDANVNLNTNPRQLAGQVSLRRPDTDLDNLLNNLPMIDDDGNFVINF